MNVRPSVILPAILAVSMFLPLLGRREFAASHEARVAQVARQMADAGWPWDARFLQVDQVRLVKRFGIVRLEADPHAARVEVNPWVLPVLNDQIRLQKPPLPYWCAAILFRLIGVSEAAARFVPALLGALTTLLIFDLARLLYGRRVAWVAALIWPTTYLVPLNYRLAMPDPYLAFFTLLGLVAWIRSTVRSSCTPGITCGESIAPSPSTPGEGLCGTAALGCVLPRGRKRMSSCAQPQPRAAVPHRPQPRAAVPQRPMTLPSPGVPGEGIKRFRLPHASPTLWLLLFYLSLALGVLAKGPLIFLDLAIPIALFHVCFPARLPRSIAGHLVGIALFLSIVLPWPIAVLKHVPEAPALWRYESLGELSGEKREGLRAAWYYLQNLPLLAMPWLPLWLFSIFYVVRRRSGPALFPLLWYALMVALFSLAGQKKMPYLLPMVPAQALMIAYATVPLLRLASRARMRGIPGAVIVAQVIIGIGWAGLSLVLIRRELPIGIVAMGLPLLALLVALAPIRSLRACKSTAWFGFQAVAYAVVLLVFANLYLTPLNNARSPRRMCEELNALAGGNHRAILESSLPEEVAFYLPLHPPLGIAPSEYLVVVDDQKGAAARAKSHRPEPPPEVEDFQRRISDAQVVAVHRIDLVTAPGDARYKVYVVSVRRQALALKIGRR